MVEKPIGEDAGKKLLIDIFIRENLCVLDKILGGRTTYDLNYLLTAL
jgi:hypothetical protein